MVAVWRKDAGSMTLVVLNPVDEDGEAWIDKCEGVVGGEEN